MISFLKHLSVSLFSFGILFAGLMGIFLFGSVGAVRAECNYWRNNDGKEYCGDMTCTSQSCVESNIIIGGVRCVGNTDRCCSTVNECAQLFPPPPMTDIANSPIGCGVQEFGQCNYNSGNQTSEGNLIVPYVNADKAQLCATTPSRKYCCINADTIAPTEGVRGTCEQLIAQLNLEDTTSQDLAFDICTQAGTPEKIASCNACVGSRTATSKAKVWTAIGCIDTSREGIVSAIVRLALGMAGGVVLLKILGSALKISMSKGEPKEIEEAREEITNAIIGVLFIVFSVVLVQFIGIDLLRIPGF